MAKKNKQATDSVQITAKGIKNALSKYKEAQAVAELIWNGFDATANCIEIKYSLGPCDFLKSLSLSDNGYGISHDALKDKFKPFHETEKNPEEEELRNSSITHGKNGVGRLTFFKLAEKANWFTVYNNGEQLLEYNITIDEKTIDKYVPTKPVNSTKIKTGTKVRLMGKFNVTGQLFELEIIPYLELEFGWFLELNKSHGYKLVINGDELDYSDIIGDREETAFTHGATGTCFDVRYVRWVNNINKEFSRYYYLDKHDKEQWKEYTRLNKKGDHFYHSVYIKSPYFENFNWYSSPTANTQALRGTGIRSDACFEFLQYQLSLFLRDRRQPFVKAYANQLVESFEEAEIIPKVFNDWDTLRINDLKETVKGLYEVQPKIFTGMNIEQKKTFVGLLGLILDSDEREKILDIIKQVVDLTPEERDQLSKLFKVTSLSRITHTITLLRDRYKAVSNLKELVFNKELGANEVKHIQQFVEAHYWLFGEEHNLVTAAEPDFEEALRRYLYILRGTAKDVKINHPGKNKEMDIFLCNQSYSKSIENIVVELKHPSKPLGKKELDQTEEYMRTILNIPEFNDRSSNWTFFLVGNRLGKANHESKPYIQSKIDQLKSLGQPFLAAIEDEMKYKVYVKTWSQIFTEFEQKHNFLNEKLEFERDRLTKKHKTADAALSDSKNNSAVQAAEVSIPK